MHNKKKKKSVFANVIICQAKNVTDHIERLVRSTNVCLFALHGIMALWDSVSWSRIQAFHKLYPHDTVFAY